MSGGFRVSDSTIETAARAACVEADWDWVGEPAEHTPSPVEAMTPIVAAALEAALPSLVAEIRESDLFLCHTCGDRLGNGPVERFDQPSVTGQADLRCALVDAGGEIVGESEINVLRHSEHGITSNSNSVNDSMD
jgi:hypothetical protein